MEAAIDNTSTNVHACVPIKLYLLNRLQAHLARGPQFATPVVHERRILPLVWFYFATMTWFAAIDEMCSGRKL